MSDNTIVYVRLLDEGIEVFRPVHARGITAGVYTLGLPADYDAGIETWEFLPGMTVRCEERTLDGARVLVAVASAST